MDKRAIRHLKRDPRLARIIEVVGDYEIQIRKNRFESLVNSIIMQQLSSSAAKSISKKLCSLYVAKFPKPEDVTHTPSYRLQRVGLSRMKAEYIGDLARKIVNGEINLSRISKLSDDEAVTELTSMKGIGTWTAHMFLIFTLGRTDIFPVGDLVLQKGIKRLYSLKTMPDENRMTEIAEKWRPFRTVATWYIWKSMRLDSNMNG